MKGLKQKLALLLIFMISGLVGFFKGSRAKQKFAVKVKSKSDQRKQVAEQKLIRQQGGVLLDDIELEAYHN